MSKKQTQKGTNSEDFAKDARAVGARLEALSSEVDSLGETLQGTVDDVGNLLRSQLKARPYATLGMAAGAGFILGGGLSVRMTSAILGLGGRLLANRVLQEVMKESQS